MFKYIYIGLIFTVALFSLFSCNEDEKTVDVPSQLFRPAMLQVTINSNIVTLSWIPIKGAKYSLDLAKDSLQFTNEVQNFVIEGKAEYTIENLWSLSRYSVRIKCLSNDPNIKDSEYKLATFVTQQENIFHTPSPSEIGTDHILVKWDATKTVSHIIVSKSATENTTVSLSDQDKAAGEKDVNGLLPATSYTFKIYNGEMLRGTITAKTVTTP